MVHAIYSIAEMDSLIGEEKEVLDEIDECKQREQEVMIMMDSLNEQLQIIDDRKENMINTIVNTIITQYFPTIHAVCIGPGLGRHPIVFSIMSRVIQNAMESKLVLVLDADALYMLSLAEYKILLRELLLYDKCVMTPNSMEMKRLTDALSSSSSSSSSSTTPSSTSSSSASTNSGVHKLQNNNNIIIQKGAIDTINNNICAMQCEEEGGLKRCGGIGDVLSGSVTAFMAWNAILEQRKKNTSDATNAAADDADDDDDIVQQQQRQQQQRVFACWSASVLVKKATKLAYEKKHRSMSAMNVLDEIGIMIYDMEEGLKQKI
jgi:ATP-dependent NAD(P)H-hydrate dehydratase